MPVSSALIDAIHEYTSNRASYRLSKGTLLFESFNRYGSMGTPLSSRGIELLVRAYADRLGAPALVPRMIRHSVVLAWHQEKVPQDEIQKRLGLRSDYAFRTYKQLWKSPQNSDNKAP